MNQLMLDIEGLSTRPNAAIVQIGAVVFDEEWEVHDQIEMNVDAFTCLIRGGHVDPNTLQWWYKQAQSNATHLEPRRPAEDIASALSTLNDIYKANECTHVWSQGPQYDVSAIEYYYKQLGHNPPWSYSQVRDLRTYRHIARELGNVEEPKETAHSAWQDCLDQLDHMRAASRFLLKNASI